MKSDLISRQALCEYALNQKDKSVTPNDIMRFPSAQPDLIAKIQNGINVTNTNDSYSCGMRNGMRWCMSLIDDKEPLYENCPSAQPEPHWIPCSERLPNSQTEVIVSVNDTSGDTPFNYTSHGWMTTDGEYWIVENEICNYVIAWMPLPEPYQEEGEKR